MSYIVCNNWQLFVARRNREERRNWSRRWGGCRGDGRWTGKEVRGVARGTRCVMAGRVWVRKRFDK